MLSPKNLKKLGIDIKDIRMVSNVQELKKTTPNFVLSRVEHNGIMNVHEVPIRMLVGEIYVMPLEVFIGAKRTKERELMLTPYDKTTFRNEFRRYNGEDLTNKSILIIRTGGIGDIMFTQPICKYIRKIWPTCKIIFATASRYMNLFESFPEGLIDSVVTVPFQLDLLKQTDYHLSFEGCIERNLQSRVEHVFDIFSKMAGLKIDHTNPSYKPTIHPQRECIRDVELYLPRKFIVIQLRATSPIRMMPTDKWIDMLDKLIQNSDESLKFVIADTPDKSPMYNRFLQMLEEVNPNSKGRVINSCLISKSLGHLIAILHLSLGSIGIDSSITHLSSALNKPVLGIYAPFNGNLRLKYYNKAVCIQPTRSICGRFPCFLHGNETVVCEFVSNGIPPICFDDISTDVIVDEFIRMWGNVKG